MGRRRDAAQGPAGARSSSSPRRRRRCSAGSSTARCSAGRCSAAAANPDLARLSGVSPKIVSTVVWAIGGLVGHGLDDPDRRPRRLRREPRSARTRHPAARPGRRSDRPVPLVPGRPRSPRSAIGVGQALLRFNFLDQPGLVDILLLARRARRGVAADPPGERRATPPSRSPRGWRRSPSGSASRSSGCATSIDSSCSSCSPCAARPAAHRHPALAPPALRRRSPRFAICALSLTVLTGWAGQLSLGQMAFAGIGALTRRRSPAGWPSTG